MKELKYSLLADNMIIYTEHPKEFTKQTSKQVNLAGVYYIKLTF